MSAIDNFWEGFEMGTKDRIQQILEEKAALEKEYEEKYELTQPASTLAAWIDLFSNVV